MEYENFRRQRIWIAVWFCICRQQVLQYQTVLWICNFIRYFAILMSIDFVVQSIYTISHMQNWIILAYQPLCTCVCLFVWARRACIFLFPVQLLLCKLFDGTFVLLRMCAAPVLLLSYECCLTSFVCCIMLRLWCYTDAEICILIQD